MNDSDMLSRKEIARKIFRGKEVTNAELNKFILGTPGNGLFMLRFNNAVIHTYMKEFKPSKEVKERKNRIIALRKLKG